MRTVLLVFLLFVAIVPSTRPFVPNSEWENFKTVHEKTYDNFITEAKRRLIYAVNKMKVEDFNRKNLESYQLGLNQYSDLTLLEFVARFLSTRDIQSNGVSYKAPNVRPPSSFSYTAQGFVSPVQNQGLNCNSGWAYASTTALQIFYASITGSLSSQTLSTQNILDCAGGFTACRNQVPQTLFDYLTKQLQKIYPESEYPNNPNGAQGMCVLPMNSNNGKTLKSYSNIPDGNDELLRFVLNYQSPVVIMVNPGTFEFMHYKKGLFTQPQSFLQASHFVTVLGYESAQGTKQGFWTIQNSFGSTWGENGMMKIEMNSAKPITKSAIFPLE